MTEKISPYLKSLLHLPSIRLQYIDETKNATTVNYNDPLMEDSHEVVKGLIHKYTHRALIKVSYQCAAHCRFCTRIRQIGHPEGRLQEDDIDAIAQYLSLHPEIDEVILSGGDPFYTPQTTKQIIEKCQAIDSIKTWRIGTRLPLQSPISMDSKLVKELEACIQQLAAQKPFFILLHVEHPDELTNDALRVIQHLRTLGVTLLSQTVFLKGINDEYEILVSLFKSLYHIGVIPYYLYRCDRVKGLEAFYADPQKEKEIAIKLRQHLSGIACPLFVEDIENGYGKIPVM
ncbi:MAG TPA: radical SAM protein [Chitinophagaceae bacterium]|nr:radical SAM protein [Chitinophagaceae bacterium]